jgi:hypothetical protein
LPLGCEASLPAYHTSEEIVRKVLATAVFVTASLMPAFAFAALIDPSLVPDGTYVVKVEKVEDAQHAVVVMDNGVETTLVAEGSINFSSIKANDTVKVSLLKGKVPVFRVQ